MEIKYWSDIACPFCYIAANRIKKALKEVNENVELELKSFQLDPGAPKETEESYMNHFTHGNDALVDQAKQQMEYIANMAHEDGLEMDINSVVPTNTMDAHRLIKLAHDTYSYDVEEKLINRLYKVYFVDGTSIADRKILSEAATEAGMKVDDINKVLDTDKYQDEVLSDLTEARQLGVQGAPFL